MFARCEYSLGLLVGGPFAQRLTTCSHPPHPPLGPLGIGVRANRQGQAPRITLQGRRSFSCPLVNGTPDLAWYATESLNWLSQQCERFATRDALLRVPAGGRVWSGGSCTHIGLSSLTHKLVRSVLRHPANNCAPSTSRWRRTSSASCSLRAARSSTMRRPPGASLGKKEQRPCAANLRPGIVTRCEISIKVALSPSDAAACKRTTRRQCNPR